MTTPESAGVAAALGQVRLDALLRRALARPGAPIAAPGDRLLVVDVERQRLILAEQGKVAAEYPVSTAANGIGGEDGSFKTPPGWMRILNCLGDREAVGRVFVSREPTERVWRGDSVDEDLILTRVITLDGLEPGVNQGPGVDTRARYIYIHGTNHEHKLSRPSSHGCVRMSNADVVDLFERVREGDPVVVVDKLNEIPDPFGLGRFHYAGLGGSGMSALAQFQVLRGGRASGSDRSFDAAIGGRSDIRHAFEKLGITIHPQDGTGVGPDCAALVVSTAVEETVPDVAAARRYGVPIVHRSELLAHFVHSMRTIAVTGTSGKSTVVAMIFEILRGAGRGPSVITGGDLVSLQREGLAGNAYSGSSDLLVVEADESDGSVVRYRAALGVVLNLQKDHKEMADVRRMFDVFGAQVREGLIVGEDEEIANLRTAGGPEITVFGFGPEAHIRGVEVELEPDGSRFEVEGTTFRLPVPGRHNVANALAAIATCRALGVSCSSMIEPLARFAGVTRRFQTIGVARGVEVIDDFAHNPAKLEASIATAHRRARRVLAVYQPHGYGPTRFLRDDLVHTFASALSADDRLWMLEVFYAGGTARRDFSASDLVKEIVARGVHAEFAASRDTLVGRIAAEARSGDLVLVMGARDPSLTELAQRVLAALESGSAADVPRASGV